MILKKPIAKKPLVLRPGAKAPAAKPRIAAKPKAAAAPQVDLEPVTDTMPEAMPLPGAMPMPAPVMETAETVKAAENATVTDLKVRLEVAEKTKDYLLAALATSVRHPLENLAMKVELLRQELAGDSQREQLAGLIAAESHVLARTVDDVLDLVSLNGCAAAQPTDVGALVGEVVESFRAEAEAKGLSISSDIGDLPDVVINAHRLRLVLRGLLENAVKFTTKGRVGVEVTYFGERLKISVEDTGCGIPLSEQNRFAEEGLGTIIRGVLPSGLAVIEHLAVSMDGDIALQSTPGLGTVIAIIFSGLPLAQGSAIRRTTSMQRIRTMKIQDQLPWKANFLLVDSSPLHRAALEGMLRGIGFENVASVASANEALVRLMSGSVDIILTEADLPQMGGESLVSQIRSIDSFKGLPVYAITDNETVAGKFDEYGFDGCLLKPITKEKLHRILG